MSTSAHIVTRRRSQSLDVASVAPGEKRVRTRASELSPDRPPSSESKSVDLDDEPVQFMPPSTSGGCATPDSGGVPHTSTPAPPIFHPSVLPACLRLPDDILMLILNEIVASKFCEPSGAAAVAHSAVADLKRLAVVHSIFLGPVRTLLYGSPNLEGSLGILKDPCACASCQVGRSAHWEHSPLRRLSDALALNPALGSFIRHLDRLGDLTQSLSHSNISPSLVSRTILGVLQRAPNVLSLDMPLVELRNQGDLVEAVTQMRHLRRLRLSSGCVRTKDGTSMMHEGDLRRIARACVGLEELEILTEHLGCGSSDGWVEPFPFAELREVRLARATSVTDKHLLAMLSSAKHLHSLTIIKSAGLDGTSGVPVPGTTKRTHSLTTTGIAAILERRGATLRHLHIDVSDQEIDTESTSGTIPSIQAALVKCPRLRTLKLSGPGLVLPSSLPHLGSPAPSTPSRSFGMPFPGPGGSATDDLPGLSNLERLSIGLYPPLYRPILDFLRSLPPTPRSSFTTLKAITITNPPANCTGHDPDATANVSALQAAVADKSIALHFTTPTFEWDTAHAWARPGGLAQRNTGAGFQVLGGGPAWAQGPLGWAVGQPQVGILVRRFNGAARAGAVVPGPPPANLGPLVRARRIRHPPQNNTPRTPAVPATFTSSVLAAAGASAPAPATGNTAPEDAQIDGQVEVDAVDDDPAAAGARRSLVVVHHFPGVIASGSGSTVRPVAAPTSDDLLPFDEGDDSDGMELNP